MMRPETVRVNALFDDPNRTYVIPLYQRDYAWTEQDQWELLFDDLANAADRAAENRSKPHFLGAVVFQNEDAGTNFERVNQFFIIDGQQRITTLQLLIRALLDVVKDLNPSADVQVSNGLLRNVSPKVKSEQDSYKLWPRLHEAWQSAMAEQPPREANHIYARARTYFASRARGYAAGSVARCERLLNTLRAEFQVVKIEIAHDDDAQMIFEVLNGRQMKLTASDLVKNLLFMEAQKVNRDRVKELYERYWAPLMHPWWDAMLGPGHAARARRDQLVSAYLTFATQDEVNIEDLYGEFRRFLHNEARDAAGVIAEISHLGSAFRQVVAQDPELPPRTREAYGRMLDRLKVTSTLPILAWLRSLPRTDISDADEGRAVMAIESWLVRRLICGSDTRGYSKYFPQLLAGAIQAKEQGASIVSAIESHLASQTGELTWPDDGVVTKQVLSRPIYQAISSDRIVMLLGAVEDWLEAADSKTDLKPNKKLHVEHLLPQDWSRWPLPSGQDPLKAKEHRDALKHQVGNLTLVTQGLNSAMKNAPWDEKRSDIQKHSRLLLNQKILLLSQWNEAEIEKRGEELAKIFCQIWPAREQLAATAAKEAQRKAPGSAFGPEARKAFRQQFWSSVSSALAEAGLPALKATDAKTVRYGTFGPHVAVNLRLSVSKKQAEVELDFHREKATATQEKWAQLTSNEGPLNAVMGTPGVATIADGRQTGKLVFVQRLSANSGPTDQPETFAWIANGLRAVQDALEV